MPLTETRCKSILYYLISAIPSQQPVLILGGEHNILAALANDMLSDPVELYSTDHIITGTYDQTTWSNLLL